jgi:hypothetical protein
VTTWSSIQYLRPPINLVWRRPKRQKQQGPYNNFFLDCPWENYIIFNINLQVQQPKKICESFWWIFLSPPRHNASNIISDGSIAIATMVVSYKWQDKPNNSHTTTAFWHSTINKEEESNTTIAQNLYDNDDNRHYKTMISIDAMNVALLTWLPYCNDKMLRIIWIMLSKSAINLFNELEAWVYLYKKRLTCWTMQQSAPWCRSKLKVQEENN